MKQIQMIKASALSLATIVVLLTLCLCVPFHHRVVVAATAEENPNTVCAADDPRQECTSPDAGSVAEDEDDSEDDNLECVDDESSCKYWSEVGECDNNPNFMLEHCRLSCGVCDSDQEINKYGVPQRIPKPGHRREEVEDIISQTIIYMNGVRQMQEQSTDDKYKDIMDTCKNKHELCSEWALDDGCDDNPNYMKVSCAPACKSCEYIIEQKEKCGVSPDSSLDAIPPGGMNQLFETMIYSADRMGFEPTVLSRPLKIYDLNGPEEVTSSCETDVTNPCNTLDGPWVITLENFVSDEEISRLLTWGKVMKYERSQAGDEITQVRTSSHSWCTDDCYNDKVVASIRQRIVDVTGIPFANFECLQLLKYDEGQYYYAHDDHIILHNKQSHGPRLLTFFIYFNEVKKGGGTQFPNLNNLTVQPKKGRVLIWPSITDDGTWTGDSRTRHEAMAVEEGQKFAANAWIHMRDFQTPFSMGCPG